MCFYISELCVHMSVSWREEGNDKTKVTLLTCGGEEVKTEREIERM